MLVRLVPLFIAVYMILLVVLFVALTPLVPGMLLYTYLRDGTIELPEISLKEEYK